MLPLIEKYRVKKFEDIKGQEAGVAAVQKFYEEFPKKKALILQGTVGVGKTSLALALAVEKNLELFELNASDLRNKSSLEAVLRPAVGQGSLFSKGKLILMDEADGITGSDRGGVGELLKLIEESNFPIIITANDIWDKKFSDLRKKCVLITLKELEPVVISRILMGVLHKEGKSVQLATVEHIAQHARGDVRAALNDLQSVFDLGEENFLQEISREKSDSIFQVLKKIFQAKTDSNIIHAFDRMDVELDELLLWVEENISLEYRGDALLKAYELLSKADLFKGRIYRQQHWRFLVYQSFFLSAGISSVTKLKQDKFVGYKRPGRILKIWLANQRNIKMKEIIARYAPYCHLSTKKANRDKYLLPFILQQIDATTKKRLDLDESDEKYLEQKRVDLVVSGDLQRFRS